MRGKKIENMHETRSYPYSEFECVGSKYEQCGNKLQTVITPEKKLPRSKCLPRSLVITNEAYSIIFYKYERVSITECCVVGMQLSFRTIEIYDIEKLM